MKIAYIIPGLDPTGPIFVVKSLVSILSKLGHEVHVYYLVDRPTTLKFDCPAIKINNGERIDFDGYDIIHSHCFRADRYVNKWNKSIRVAKWITTIHQDTKKSFEFFYPKLFSRILTNYWLKIQNKADGIVAISELVRSIHLPYITKPYKTIYNGITIDRTTEIEEGHIKIREKINELKNNGRYVVATYANIVERKGLDQVLKCLEKNSKFDFVIVGDGSYKKVLIEMTKKLKLDSRVHFFPFVSRPYLGVQNADVYVMPSYSEGFGLALLEAAAMGLPIVCSNLPSFHELFGNNDALFFNCHDIDTMSYNFDIAIDKSGYYAERSKLCASKYSEDKMGIQHLKFYKLILEGKKLTSV